MARYEAPDVREAVARRKLGLGSRWLRLIVGFTGTITFGVFLWSLAFARDPWVIGFCVLIMAFCALVGLFANITVFRH